MMISDSVQVALISETLEAVSPQRRRAAKILLDLSRSGGLRELSELRLPATCEAAVAAEARALLELFGLGGEAQ